MIDSTFNHLCFLLMHKRAIDQPKKLVILKDLEPWIVEKLILNPAINILLFKRHLFARKQTWRIMADGNRKPTQFSQKTKGKLTAFGALTFPFFIFL